MLLWACIIIAVWLLTGVIASVTPKRYHTKVRVFLVSIGFAYSVIPFLDESVNMLPGIVLIISGTLFVPTKKQVELFVEVVLGG